MRWELALRMWQEEPLNGIGIGNYEEQFKFYLENQEEVRQISYWFGWERAAHSEIFTRLAEQGIVGAGFYVLLFGMPFVFFQVILKKRIWSRQFVAVTAAAYASFLIHGLFNDLTESFSVTASAILIWAFAYQAHRIKPMQHTH